MTAPINCYCDSGKAFSDCCELIITKKMRAQTCEQLMRARYSAHVVEDIEFIVQTCHPDVRSEHNAEKIKQWCEQVSWQGLRVISAKQGLKKGFVEFEARYSQNDAESEIQVHHEYSEFRKHRQRWYFYSASDSE
jgi:SEC-C motif domain protein